MKSAVYNQNMKRIIIIFGIICTLFTACSERKSNTNPPDETNPTATVPDKSTVKTLDLSDTNSLWLLMSLGLNVISIVFVVYILLKQRGFRDKVIDIVVQSHRINDFIESKINFPDKAQVKTVNSTQKAQKKILLSDAEKTEIIEDLQAMIRCDIDELIAERLNNISPTIEKKAEPEYRVVSKNFYLYASPANKSTNEFYTVTDEPNSKTIYRLTLSEDKQSASFDVFADAHSKVLQSPDFLEGACDLQDLGSQRLTTKKQGEARKQSDGKWTIISQAKIIFE